MTTYYTTTGSVRGCCDHKHRTIETAQRCIDRDHAGCKSQGGYSDRKIVAVVDGERRPLTEEEYLYSCSIARGSY